MGVETESVTSMRPPPRAVTRDSDVDGYATNSDGVERVTCGNTPHDNPHAASNNERRGLVRSALNKSRHQPEAQTMMPSSVPPFRCGSLANS